MNAQSGSRARRRSMALSAMTLAAAVSITGCAEWRGPNSLPLPGTEGSDGGGYTVKVELPDVTNLKANSRVRVNDVNVGNVTDIELNGWSALVTVELNQDVSLPKNATAKVGQTSLLGTVHLELAAPIGQPPEGTLENGDVIPLDHSGTYPTTEQTLASLSVVLNGGGLAQLQEINKELNAALGGHEVEVRSLIGQLDMFTASLDAQVGDIIAAFDGLDRLTGIVNQQNDVLDRALNQIPPALEILSRERENLANALTGIGEFAGLADYVVSSSYDDLARNLQNLGPALRELADAGINLTRGLGLIATFPWPQKGVEKFIRGDAANLSATVDLTLGRMDNSYLQMTPADGALTQLETMLGRTAGRQPTPATKNPLTAPILRGEG